jgi:PKD repeat protein
MKNRIISLITVVMLIGMVLPATSPPPVAAQPSAWPTAWEGLDTDDDGSCEAFRNVLDTNGDGYALYYDVDSDYIYLRMETASSPGWPGTDVKGEARYKWWFDTQGTSAYVHGTTVEDAEFLLILEDRTDTSDVDGNRDLLGELTFMDDLANIGFAKRWNKGGSGAYITGTPDNGGNSTLWMRELGTGTNGTGGPQGVMIGEIGYRINDTATGGYFVDMYVSRAALGDPTSLCIIWATDNQNPNLDQAPNCDRPEQPNCIMLGKDYGDAPDSPYPTLMTNDGARHTVGNISLGATIDAELDGQESPNATGDDDTNVDDEDGVDFTTTLIKGQSADVTVTASGGDGYLNAWVDFNANGDWGDAGEQIFTNQSLSAGTHNLNFTVPFSATVTNQTFARFRFSSAGGLSYDGPADDGEVEDYQVAIEGCTITVDLTGDTSFCEGSSTTITANVTDGKPPYSYDWTASNAPGSSDNGSYNATGSGIVAVTVTDDNGCTGSANLTVTALQGPTAAFSANATSCCDPLAVKFTDLSTAGSNNITDWYWDFGDGTNSTDQHPIHIYTTGTYNVTLTVTDEHGCSGTKTEENYITANQGPTADFSANVTDCCAPLAVNFTDLSTAGSNNITDWFWDFGDGHNSTDQNPTHTFDAGTYNVTLTVTDEHGCSGTKTEIEYITSNKGPTAAFSANATSCCDPLAVKFTDLSTAGSNNITDWYWDFGDGTNSTDQHPIHIYTTGTYNVTLTVTDEHGCSGTKTEENYITANQGPTADFSANVTDCCAPLAVNFTDLSTAGSNNITDWFWDFGDGHNSTDQNPTHTFDAGTYNVTLTVTDEHGCSGTKTEIEYITSNKGPTAAFSANATSCCDPLAVKFTDLSTAGSNNITDWYWDFGDGTNSTDQHPIHIYTTGTYNVTLTVTDEHGCSGTKTETEYITSNEVPTADFSANATKCSLTVQFNDESTEGSNNITGWYWDFGDGTNSILQHPSHTYDAPGTYNVTLTVTDSHGCSDTKTEDGTVYAKPTATASSNSPVLQGATIELYGGPDGMTSYNWTGPGNWTSSDRNPTRTGATTAMAGTYTLVVTSEQGCTDDATTNVVVIVPEPRRGGGGGCPTIKELTVDWDGHNTTEELSRNDRLTVDLLGPNPDSSHSLLLEQGTHAPTVGERTYYLIVIRELELEDIPPLAENTTAIVAFNVTPEGAVFDRDIFLTLGFDELQLPENALNTTMAYYDDVNGVWVLMDSEAGGPPNTVAELSLSAPLNHFTIYAVLVEFAPVTPPPPANFVGSGLNIETSVETGIFVTKTGESVSITANVANNGGQEGTYTVELKLDGETVDTEIVTLGVGQSQGVSFTLSGMDYGQHEVEVAGLSDEFTTSRTITWWLILVIIVAIGLIIWGVVWGRRRRRRAAQEG